MNIRKIIFLTLPWVLILILSFFLFRQCNPPEESPADDNKQVITNNMVVEKIEAIGKLEVVRFYIKDIIEHTTELEWWPDPKVILIVSGEVIGCIDLSKIDSSSVIITPEEITITLPNPEICSFKVNHEESKVYNVHSKMMSEAHLIDKAYKEAESSLKAAAIKMNIYDHVKINSKILLQPMIENFTGKKVIIRFK